MLKWRPQGKQTLGALRGKIAIGGVALVSSAIFGYSFMIQDTATKGAALPVFERMAAQPARIVASAFAPLRAAPVPEPQPQPAAAPAAAAAPSADALAAASGPTIDASAANSVPSPDAFGEHAGQTGGKLSGSMFGALLGQEGGGAGVNATVNQAGAAAARSSSSRAAAAGGARASAMAAHSIASGSGVRSGASGEKSFASGAALRSQASGGGGRTTASDASPAAMAAPAVAGTGAGGSIGNAGNGSSGSGFSPQGGGNTGGGVPGMPGGGTSTPVTTATQADIQVQVKTLTTSATTLQKSGVASALKLNVSLLTQRNVELASANTKVTSAKKALVSMSRTRPLDRTTINALTQFANALTAKKIGQLTIIATNKTAIAASIACLNKSANPATSTAADSCYMKANAALGAIYGTPKLLDSYMNSVTIFTNGLNKNIIKRKAHKANLQIAQVKANHTLMGNNVKDAVKSLSWPSSAADTKVAESARSGAAAVIKEAKSTLKQVNATLNWASSGVLDASATQYTTLMTDLSSAGANLTLAIKSWTAIGDKKAKALPTPGQVTTASHYMVTALGALNDAKKQLTTLEASAPAK